MARLLDDSNDFRTAQQLHAELRRRGEGIGMTTVYRTLQSLAETGEVDVLRTDSGEAIYRFARAATTITWSAATAAAPSKSKPRTVERWADRIASTHGFSQTSHTAELFGQCPDCCPIPRI